MLVEDKGAQLIAGLPPAAPVSGVKIHALVAGVDLQFAASASTEASSIHPEGWQCKLACDWKPGLSDAETARSGISTKFQAMAAVRQRVHLVVRPHAASCEAGPAWPSSGPVSPTLVDGPTSCSLRAQALRSVAQSAPCVHRL